MPQGGVATSCGSDGDAQGLEEHMVYPRPVGVSEAEDPHGLSSGGALHAIPVCQFADQFDSQGFGSPAASLIVDPFLNVFAFAWQVKLVHLARFQ